MLLFPNTIFLVALPRNPICILFMPGLQRQLQNCVTSVNPMEYIINLCEEVSSYCYSAILPETHMQ